jgi:hypothetical protein
MTRTTSRCSWRARDGAMATRVQLVLRWQRRARRRQRMTPTRTTRCCCAVGRGSDSSRGGGGLLARLRGMPTLLLAPTTRRRWRRSRTARCRSRCAAAALALALMPTTTWRSDNRALQRCLRHHRHADARVRRGVLFARGTRHKPTTARRQTWSADRLPHGISNRLFIFACFSARFFFRFSCTSRAQT